jgi:hypothetical protein
MKKLWWIAPLTLALMAGVGWLLLRTPGRTRLELYDVQDLVYGMNDFPSVDISLAQNPNGYDPVSITGMELAERICFLLPESSDRNDEEKIDFANGMIIARTTAIKQAAVFGIIATHRVYDRFLMGLHAHDAEIGKALSKLLPAGRK